MLLLYRMKMKRVFDFWGSILGLIINVLCWPLIALAIKLDSSGPILVKLERISAGKVIKVYKFRSMIDHAHELKPQLQHLNERKDGPFFKIKNDPRLTRVGKIIRKFRIDEIPQFINVLKGELSLVGPRPHEPEEIEKYPEKYKALALVRAGITGLSQISGGSSLKAEEEWQLDKYYIENQSLWLDIKIIAKTIAIMFFDPTAV